jgi:sugar O-acyltransferase (sialic acid O-acetyltransferase NeuD family)
MKKDKKLIIIGAGETAMLAYEYFTFDSEYEVTAFSVNKAYINESILYDLPIIALENIKKTHPIKDYEVFIAMSSGKLNRVRTEFYNNLKSMGYVLASYVSSKAFVWKNVKIGDNCFILENNTLQPFVNIGNNVTLWSGNHIGHRSLIQNNCFISSHCVVSGFCDIGENSFLGVNCTLENNVIIEADNFIGAGSLIQKNTVKKSFYQRKQTDLSKINTHRLFKIRELDTE